MHHHATNLNDLLASNPNLTNNPYYQGYLSGHNDNNNNVNASNQNNHNASNQNGCMHPSNEWIIELLKEKQEAAPAAAKWGYFKAIKGVKNYTFAIRNKVQAMQVKGIGKHCSSLIVKGLYSRNLYSSSAKIPPQIQPPPPPIPEAQLQANKQNTKKMKKSKKKPYSPKPGSGNYAILIHLYKSWTEDGVHGLSKQQIIRDAQQYTTTSFTEANQSQWYTAWSNMPKLIECDYVQKIKRRQATYYLTETGKLIARKLYAQRMGLPVDNELNTSIFNDAALVTETDEKYKFKCQYCNKLYVRKGPFEKHIETKHPNGSNAKPKPPILLPENDTNNHKKRKYDDMMSADDEIEICAKKPRIVSMSNEYIDVKEPILINGRYYKLNLVYDYGERGNKNRNERASIHDQFNRYQDIFAKGCSLSIGDFVWTLQSIEDAAEEWLYPVVIERKRMDDLICSIRDKRYIEQKWRIKHILPNFDHIYLIEKYMLKDEIEEKQFKQALVETTAMDKFFVFFAESLIECVRVLSNWTRLIYRQITKKLENNKGSSEYDFFENEDLLWFASFNKEKHYKKNLSVSAKILFGRMLMSIPNVTDSIASLIIRKYKTMRCLHKAWSKCESEERQKMLLYDEMNGNVLEWHKDLDSEWITLDADLKNICAHIDKATFKPISKGLSEKIWNAFYN